MRHKKKRAGEVLRDVRLFEGCSDKELARIGALLTEVEVPEGRVLCKEGEPGNECFVIGEGKATVSREGTELATLSAGDVVGEMALLDQDPRSATVTAQTALKLFVLESREFWTVLSENPLVARKIMKNLAQRLRRAEGAPTS